METAYIGIGSNLGERRKNIDIAIEHLRKTPLTFVEKISSIYETDPAGGPPQGKFLNGAIKIKTALSPQALLKRLKEIEKMLGRVKTVKDGPRIMDLDILMYGQQRISGEELTLPHPRMNEREFVLRGLNEIRDEDIS